MTNTAYIELIFRSPMFHDGTGVCLGDGQMETYLKDMGMTGLVSAWAMAGRTPRNTVAKWTRRRAAPAYDPTPDLT